MPRDGMMLVTSSVPQASNRDFSSNKQKSHLWVAFLRISISMIKTPRQLASENGDTRYFTGKPCKNGHIAERLVSNRECVDCKLPKKREWGNMPHVKEKSLQRANQWDKDNPHKKLARTRKRQAAKLNRTPKWLTADDFFMIEEAYHLAKLRTELTGISWHVDHILPLQGRKVSGLHVPANLQVIPAKINLHKSNKHE